VSSARHWPATIGNMLEFYEALPQNIGCGVFATVYAVAMASFGGTAQLVVTWLHDVTGNPLAPKRM
jgi:MFS transporter, MHS family, citrate/tricarballylate:H+ symporter